MKSEQEVYDLARRMVLRVLDMKPGDRTTVAMLVHEIEPSLPEEKPGNTMLEDFLFDVTEALFDLSLDEGDLLLDISEHDGKEEGLPFDLDFIVRRRISGKNLDVDALLEKLEWFYFTIRESFLRHSEVTFRKDYEGAWRQVDDQENSFWLECPEVSDQDIEALKQLTKDTGILTWEVDYWEPFLDGIQWELQLRFNDGTYFESSGSNGYPTGFDELVKGLAELGLKTKVIDFEHE